MGTVIEVQKTAEKIYGRVFVCRKCEIARFERQEDLYDESIIISSEGERRPLSVKCEQCRNGLMVELEDNRRVMLEQTIVIRPQFLRQDRVQMPFIQTNSVQVRVFLVDDLTDRVLVGQRIIITGELKKLVTVGEIKHDILATRKRDYHFHRSRDQHLLKSKSIPVDHRKGSYIQETTFDCAWVFATSSLADCQQQISLPPMPVASQLQEGVLEKERSLLDLTTLQVIGGILRSSTYLSTSSPGSSKSNVPPTRAHCLLINIDPLNLANQLKLEIERGRSTIPVHVISADGLSSKGGLGQFGPTVQKRKIAGESVALSLILPNILANAGILILTDAELMRKDCKEVLFNIMKQGEIPCEGGFVRLCSLRLNIADDNQQNCLSEVTVVLICNTWNSETQEALSLFMPYLSIFLRIQEQDDLVNRRSHTEVDAVLYEEPQVLTLALPHEWHAFSTAMVAAWAKKLKKSRNTRLLYSRLETMVICLSSMTKSSGATLTVLLIAMLLSEKKLRSESGDENDRCIALDDTLNDALYVGQDAKQCLTAYAINTLSPMYGKNRALSLLRPLGLGGEEDQLLPFQKGARSLHFRDDEDIGAQPRPSFSLSVDFDY